MLTGIQATLAVYSAGDPTTLNIFDQNDSTNHQATLDNQSGNPNAPYEITGLSSGVIEYGAGISALNIWGGFAGVKYTVSATQMGTSTTLFNGGNDDVDITDWGSVTAILGSILVNNVGHGTGTDLTVDGSADTTDHHMLLTGGPDYSTLAGLTPDSAYVYYENDSLNSLTIFTGPAGNQDLTIDFTNGNPIPTPWLTNVPGLSFNAGADSTTPR